MKNNSNIYDIDDNLIRAAGDNHVMSIQEAQEKIEFYKNKLEEVKDDEKKVAIYGTYIRNLNKYILEQYSKMTPTQFKAELDRQKIQKDTDKQVEEAINELKKEIENEESEQNEESSEQFAEGGTQEANSSTGTEERGGEEAPERPETIMDEYVDFEEVNE